MKAPHSARPDPGGGLDLGLGAEGGLADVDGLTAPEACEDLGVGVAHTWSTAA
jgi:hypothetical protein